jgi:tetratricopeptide (TPR) repeat protein
MHGLEHDRLGLDRVVAPLQHLDGRVAEAPPHARVNLGDTFLGEDDLDRAEEIFQEARSSARAKGDRMAMSFALQYLGAVSYQRGDLDEAEARFREALAVFEAFRSRPGITWSWYYLAMIARDRGDLAEARSRFLEVIEWFRENDYRPGIAVALLGLATLELREDARRPRRSRSARWRKGRGSRLVRRPTRGPWRRASGSRSSGLWSWSAPRAPGSGRLEVGEHAAGVPGREGSYE